MDKGREEGTNTEGGNEEKGVRGGERGQREEGYWEGQKRYWEQGRGFQGIASHASGP